MCVYIHRHKHKHTRTVSIGRASPSNRLRRDASSFLVRAEGIDLRMPHTHAGPPVEACDGEGHQGMWFAG
jgi:hypothetical protein